MGKKDLEEDIVEKKKKKKPKKKTEEEARVVKKKSAKKKKELKIVDDTGDIDEDETPPEEVEEEAEEEPEKKKKEKKEKPKPDWYTDDEHTRNWMMLANATYIGALITYISTKEREDLDMEMIRFQVVQGLFSNILMVFWPAYLVFALIAVLKAKEGECWEMPGFSIWARRALGMEIKEKEAEKVKKETDDEE